MEHPEKYQCKLEELEKAIKGFEDLLKEDLKEYSTIIFDAIQNGQIQKFEYCSELLWKTAKVFLEDRIGLVLSAPKNVYRGLFQNEYIDEETCEKLILMVDHRNLLSHIYKEDYFKKVLKHLPRHLLLMKIVFSAILKDNINFK